MAVKFEKITLWTASETYGVNDRGLSALDYIIPALDKIEEGKVLDYDTEDYKLVKVEAAKAEATIASAPELLVAAEAARGVLEALCNWIAEDPNAQHYEDCDPDGSQGCTCPISSAPDARSRLGSAIAKAKGTVTAE